MLKIGVLSDTHGCFDDSLKKFFDQVDELWHAGDIGSLALADQIAAFKPLCAVHGNIDDVTTRMVYPEVQRFTREHVSVLMTHISGYPDHYDQKTRGLLNSSCPNLLVGGHSHILKVMYDKKFNLLFINPGAAGKSGFHQIRTAVRFVINDDKFTDMEVGEWPRY